MRGLMVVLTCFLCVVCMPEYKEMMVLGAGVGECLAGVILYPEGEVNDRSRPSVNWTCTSGHNEASLLLIDDRTGSAIYEAPWQKIGNNGNRCSLPRVMLGRIIIPPFPPPQPCQGSGCVTVHPPKHGGLIPGDYTLRLLLRGGGVAESSETAKFTLVDNIYSSFSDDAAGWKSLSGSWEVLAGQYSATGNTQGMPWISLYSDPVFRNSTQTKFQDGRHFEARMSPVCTSERCYAGIVTYMDEAGMTGGVQRYHRAEVVISGANRLYIRSTSDRSINDASPQYNDIALDGLDVSAFLRGKAVYTLTIHQADVTPGSGSPMGIYIDGQLVHCGRIPRRPGQEGRAGLIFASHETFESINVDEFVVRPTKYWKSGTMCRDQLPY